MACEAEAQALACEAEARLSDVRLFVYTEYRESNAAMAGYGMFYVNYITPDQQHIRLSDPVYFWRYALLDGEFSTLAKQVLCSLSSALISPGAQDLVAQEFSACMNSCFKFQRTTLRPGNDYEEGPECGMAKYIVDLQLQRFAQSEQFDDTSVDDFYRTLHALRSSSLYSNKQHNHPLLVSHEAKHAEVALAVANNTFLMVKRSFKLMHPKDLAHDHSDCSICFDDIHNAVAAKLLPCNHVFHRDCIFKWLSKNKSCPYCLSYCVVDLLS